MITIFEPTETDFSTNGLGVLEPLSCYLNVTINGAWVVEMEHPYDSENKYEKITKDNIIKITGIPIITEQTSRYQLFRVYDVVRTLSTVKAIAFPVAFEATYDAIIEELKTDKKTATATLQDVMTYLNNHGVTKYTVTSDYSMVDPSQVRQKKGNWENTNLIALINGSDDSSIINHWGGEVAYDNYKIIVNGKIGREAEGLRVEHEEYLFNQTEDLCETTNENGWKFTFTKQNDNQCLCAVVRNNDSPLGRYYYQKIFFIAPLIEGYTAENVSWIYDVDFNNFHWEGENPIENDTESYSYIGDGYPVYRRAKFTSTFTYNGVTWIAWRGNIINTSTYNSYTPLTEIPVVGLPQITIDDDILTCKAIIDSAGAYIFQNEYNYEIRYGKNLTGLTVDVDMSSVVTRLYPVSKDGVRLSWLPTPSSETPVSYVDSNNIIQYPYIRSAFVEVDNQLVDTSFKVNQVNSDTAIATHTAQTTITNAIRTVASELWANITTGLPYNTKWYEPEWVQSVIDDVIKTLQTELTNTWSITHPTLKNLIQSCIKEGIEWIKKEDIADFTWDNSLGDWQYTNGSRTITDQYFFIDRRYCYFNASGNYEPWKDVSSMDWIQNKVRNEKRKYGNNQRYFAKSETVYTMSGNNQDGSTFSQYYFDSDGWWDGNSEESEWNWHQSGNKYWFGETDADDDESKYAHDCWLYIYNTNLADPQKALYYFDSDGYMVPELTTVVNWGWHEKENRWYFGSTTKSQRAVYLKNQWLKIDNTWRKFGSDYYPVKNKTLVDQITTLLKNALNNSLGGENGVIKIQSGILYDILYQHLKDYCGRLYNDERIDLPTETVKVNLVELSMIEGYEDFSHFEQIHLGNEVHVYDYVHNFTLYERIVGLKYDCIRGYNTEVTISEPPKTLPQAVTGGALGKLKNGDTSSLVAGEGIDITNGVIGMTYIPSGDAFQGTQVIVEPQLVSGTKVADIYTDGTPHSIYAPSPTAYTAGANVQISQQNVISATDTTYNDFAGSAHGLVPAVGSGDSGYLKTDGTWDEPEGTAVEANPSGTATDTLSTILIDDTIYEIQGGGGIDLSLYNNWNNGWQIERQETSLSIADGEIYRNWYDPSKSSSRTGKKFLPTGMLCIAYDASDNQYQLPCSLERASDYETDMMLYYSVINNTGYTITRLHLLFYFDSPKSGSSGGGGGASALSDLSDVNVSNPTAGQVLTHNGEEWVNANPSGGLTAVELTKAQYDALPSEAKLDENKIYFVTDYP